MLLLFFFLDFPFVFYILILNILLKRYNKKKKAKKKMNTIENYNICKNIKHYKN